MIRRPGTPGGYGARQVASPREDNQGVAADGDGPDARNGATLVLVCKRPMLGAGKQRLAQAIGPTLALEAARLLLECALEDLRDWPGRTVIAPARRADRTWALALVPGADVVPQRGGNLGQRLNDVDRELRARGHRETVFIGMDAPGLSADDYARVPVALAEADAVFVPARDGGVLLMGSRRRWPPLAGLPWSTPALGSSLMQLCAGEASMRLLEPGGFDVDDVEDLLHAADVLAADARPARRALVHWVRQRVPERAATVTARHFA